MSVTTERPGVYSSYTLSGRVRGAGSGTIVGLAAAATAEELPGIARRGAAYDRLMDSNPCSATAQELEALLNQCGVVTESLVREGLAALQARYTQPGSGLTLLRLGDHWQLATKNEYGDYVRRTLETKRAAPLSQAALETLTVIAYNQPVSRAFIEQVRGVDSSSSVASLLEKGLIEEAGRLDLPGRPVSFRTTDHFLRVFGLSSLDGLPPIHTPEEEKEGTL